MNKIYDGYEYGELGYPEMHQNLLPLLESGDSALDLGFGTGHTCSPIAFAGLTIDGVDRNGYWLEEAREAFIDAGLNDLLTTYELDALEFLQKNTKTYNLVTMSDFLMFLPKTKGKKVIELAFGALKKDGYIWIATMSTSDEYYPYMTRSQSPIDDETYMSYSPCGSSGLICFYFPLEIDAFLESMGGKVIFSKEVESDSSAMVNIVLVQKIA